MNDIRAALSRSYSSPEWALFFELRNDAGFRASRIADAFAMNTWPSRGLQIHGFEIKTDRRDFLRELKDPAKSVPIQQFCDYWWIIATPDVAKAEELPATWGLRVLRGKRLMTEKDAPKLPDPKPFTRGLVATILRSADEGKVSKADWNDSVAKAVEERSARTLATYKAEEARIRRELDELRQRVKRFSDASGIDLLAEYEFRAGSPEKLGRAVRALLGGGIDIKRLRWSRDNIQELVAAMSATLEAIESVGIDPTAKGEAAE
jgi:hypothetical protein